MFNRFFNSLSVIKIFDDEESKRVAEIINVVGIVSITGLMFVLLQRIMFEEVQFLPEIMVCVFVISASLFILRTGKIYIAGILIIAPLFMLVFYLAARYDGLHDYSLLALPGLLIIAAMVFPNRSFYFFLFLCLAAIVAIGMLEIKGVTTPYGRKTIEVFDMVDIIVIIGLTGVSIRIFSERLKQSLVKAKENEKSIKENERKYRSLVSALPDIVFRIDKKGIFRDYSAPASSKLLYKKEEFLNKSIMDLMPPEIAERTADAINAALETGEIQQLEYKLTVEGIESDWEARITGINENETIVVVRDITERMKIEEALRISEEIFESFMEYSPIYVFFKDSETRPIRLSRNYEKLLNMPIKQILGKTMYDLFPVDLAKSMTEDDLNILRNGKMIKISEELDGKFFETIKFPIAIQGVQKYLAGFTIDVTETKKYEMQLKKYTEELKEANLGKEKFFSIIAHDLRSPFLGILGSIEMLSIEYDVLTDGERRLLINRIGSSIRKTFDLLENLLNWTRVQSGKIHPNSSEINLLVEIMPVITLLKEYASHKNIQIENGINPEHSAFVDKDMLKTIIRNLVSNAIKFSLHNGKIKIDTELKGGQVIVKVADNGIGMDSETLGGLFRMQAAKSRLGTLNESGTGIGLLVCKEMVELNRGKIWVESEEGKGTTFFFSLPVPK